VWEIIFIWNISLSIIENILEIRTLVVYLSSSAVIIWGAVMFQIQQDTQSNTLEDLSSSKTEIPIYGSVINDGINAPFADLYLDMFPEWYDIE
jgi:hypothetical protein